MPLGVSLLGWTARHHLQSLSCSRHRRAGQPATPPGCPTGICAVQPQCLPRRRKTPVAALRCDGVSATGVFDGAIDGASFPAFVEQGAGAHAASRRRGDHGQSWRAQSIDLTIGGSVMIRATARPRLRVWTPRAEVKPSGSRDPSSEPRNCRPAHGVALRQLLQRSDFPPSASFRLLHVGEFRWSAHALPSCLAPAPPLGRAGADQVALHVGQAAEDGNHQPPRCRRRCRPRAPPRIGTGRQRPRSA